MSSPRETVDALTWSLALRCRRGDVLMVGVATPLAAAAAMLAREILLDGELTIIMAGSVDPLTHDVAVSLVEPPAAAQRSLGTLSQGEILDTLQRGRVTLQFISPAEVDGGGRINTNQVAGRDGGPRRLPGALALPDVAILVGRLVAYRAEHSTRFLVPRVQYVTGAGGDIDRTGARGGGVRAVVTELAEFDLPGDGERPRLAALQPGARLQDVREGCGFVFDAAADPPRVRSMPAEARELLDTVIDPHEVRLLEVRGARADALARLQGLTT